MQAAIINSIGTSYNLKYTSINKPAVKMGHALIRVLYCGVNHLDFLIATGKRTGPKKFPHILGSEIVGEIVSINTNDAGLKNGDHVCIYPWIYCGVCVSCRKGNTQICDKGGTIGRTTWGGYAEYASVPIHNLIKISKKLSTEAVCSITLTGTTAYHLIKRANIPDRSLVLLTGATGGVGLLLIQLLKQKNCSIVATSSSRSKMVKLKKLGLEDVFLLEQFPKNAKKKYPKGFPYIVDIIGGKIWSNSVELLAKQGSMSFCSTTLDDLGEVQIGAAFSREINLFGSYGGTIDDLKAAIKLLQMGVLQPVIYETIPLKNAQNALKKLQNRKVFGKILLKV